MKVTFVFDFKKINEHVFISPIFAEVGRTGVTFEVPLSNYGYLKTCSNPVEKFGLKFVAERIHGYRLSRFTLILTNIFLGTYQLTDNLDRLWQTQLLDIISGNCITEDDLEETFSEMVTRIVKSRLQRLTVQKQAIILLGIKKRRVPALEWCDRFVIREISKLVLKSGQIGLGEEGVKK